MTLANSPGWKLTGPKETKIREPLTSLPTIGRRGSISRPTPMTMNVYRYRSRSRTRRTTTRVAMKAPIPTAVHVAWRPARSSFRRAMKT